MATGRVHASSSDVEAASLVRRSCDDAVILRRYSPAEEENQKALIRSIALFSAEDQLQ